MTPSHSETNAPKPRRILVTGATGLVGCHAVRALSGQGIEALAVSRGRLAAGVGPAANVTHVSADLTDLSTHAPLLAATRPDAILNLAWTTAHGSFWNDPRNLDWCGITLHLTRCAVEAGVRRFIGAGTCVEYGAARPEPCREDQTGLRPHTLYGHAKDATRRLMTAFAAEAHFTLAWARLFNVTGPGEPRAKLLTHTVAETLAGRTPVLREPDRHVDLVDCRDAGAALAAIATSDIAGIVNVGTGRATRIGDLPAIVAYALKGDEQRALARGASPPPAISPPFSGLVADITRLESEAGYTPMHDVVQSAMAIAETIKAGR